MIACVAGGLSHAHSVTSFNTDVSQPSTASGHTLTLSEVSWHFLQNSYSLCANANAVWGPGKEEVERPISFQIQLLEYFPIKQKDKDKRSWGTYKLVTAQI
jgi:hypothetical protein